MKLTIVIKIFLFYCLIYLFSCTVTSTEAEVAMNNQINLRINMVEGRLKHTTGPKKSSVPRTEKQNRITRESGLGRNTNIIDLAQAGSMPGKQLSIGNGPVYYEGWVKYINYQRNNPMSKNFFRNNEFFEQQKYFPNGHINETSSDKSDSSEYIKSPLYFYAMVFTDNINFISSKMGLLQKTYDVLTIRDIAPVTEDPGYGSEPNKPGENNVNGIQDFGTFSEGYCLKILTEHKSWIICTDTEQEKETFMAKVNKLKIKQQRDNGIFITKENQAKNDETIIRLMNPNAAETQNIRTSNDTSVNGYWIVLQGWSQCSLTCGGGVSTFQRLCIPPKNGGKPCEGDAIITRSCNTQECPKVNALSDKVSNKSAINLPPIVKVLPFSSRPQRYTKCVVKESDLMYTQYGDSQIQNNKDISFSDPNFQKMQIPARVVMNNQTFSIFGGELYTSLIASYNMDTATFGKSTHKSCFMIMEGKRTSELCPFGFSNDDKIYQEWNYQFNLFKYQCKTPKVKDTSNLELEFQKTLAKKLQEAKAAMLAEREKELKNKAIDDENMFMNKIIQTTNNVALQAIDKEMNIEAMIRREEYEREQKEEELILMKIEEEKRKSECLMKAIKERQIENQYNLRTEQTKKEIAEIKKSATDQVQIKRNQLKNQIHKMRSEAKRRQDRLLSQLQTIRATIAAQMSNAYRKGDDSKCENGMKDDNDRKHYCEANFPENFISYSTCINQDEFCRVCCENEFGEMFQSDRTKCLNTICSAGAWSEATPGRWVYQTSIKLN